MSASDQFPSRQRHVTLWSKKETNPPELSLLKGLSGSKTSTSHLEPASEVFEYHLQNKLATESVFERSSNHLISSSGKSTRHSQFGEGSRLANCTDIADTVKLVG
jgi:hypothetical protein